MRAYNQKLEEKKFTFIGLTHGIGCSLVIMMDGW
jgi:hypothetical protein